AGRLPAALEDVADYARGYAELRRAIGQAFAYPLIVLLFGYGLFLAFLMLFVPRVRLAFDSLGVSGARWASMLEKVVASVFIWGPILPLLAVCCIAIWLWIGWSRGLDATRALHWVPWLASAMRNWRLSNFTGWLALLSDHGVPLSDAVVLAGRPARVRAPQHSGC